LGPVKAELSVEVSKEDVGKAMDKAYAQLSRTARVRGFRKGKAPRAVLRRMYGEALCADVRSDLVADQFRAAIEEHNVLPISQPDIDAGELREGEDYSFKVTFEVKPQLEEIKFDDITIERLRVTVEPEAVDGELKKLQSSLASVSDPAEPRPAKEGDLVLLQVKNWINGEWHEANPQGPNELVIGEGEAPKKLEDALIGMNIGEEKVIDFGSESDLEEQRNRIMVTISALKERTLPEIDDELAKDAGDHETLDDLKKDLEKRIKEAREHAEDQRVRMQLFDALRDKNPMELPPSLVNRHTAALQMQLFGSMTNLPQDEEGQEQLKKITEGAEKAARNMVHQHLLMTEIARLQDLMVEPEEIDAEIENRAQMSGVPLPMIKAEMAKEGRREELSMQILEKKIFDFAKSLVKIEEVDKLTEPEPESKDSEEQEQEEDTEKAAK
jgi:trigger factor